jgi:predicted transcriptional regulator
MNDRKHLLISLEERHAENILAGTKRVELRRRIMHLNRGDIVWLYVKKPIGAVVGYFVVGDCVTASPESAWRRFGKFSGLLRQEFVEYFRDVVSAFILEVESPKKLKNHVLLTEIRAATAGFHPPQFYCRLDSKLALRDMLIKHAKSSR